MSGQRDKRGERQVDKEEDGQTELMERLELHSSLLGPCLITREEKLRRERERERLSSAALPLNAELFTISHVHYMSSYH